MGTDKETVNAEQQEDGSTEIAITKDLADVCVDEGQETRASVEIDRGSLPRNELSFRWIRVESNNKETPLEGQTSFVLLFEQTERKHDGSYYVEIFCNAHRHRRSRTMRLRVVPSVLGKVQDIIRTEGNALTTDTPRVVIIDSAGQRMYYMLLHILLTEALTIYVAAVSLA